MNQPSKTNKIDLTDLLETDRELSAEELDVLQQVADGAWMTLRSELHDRAANVYGVAAPDEFTECVTQHMDLEARRAMAEAEVYSCPDCGRHLKDRRTPVASSVLGERRRLRDLYLCMDRASEGPDREKATRQFIAALGILGKT